VAGCEVTVSEDHVASAGLPTSRTTFPLVELQ